VIFYFGGRIGPTNRFTMDVEGLMTRVNARYGWTTKLKEKQREILELLVAEKKNVFAVLPTGFGKRYLFLLPPLMLDEVRSDVGLLLILDW